MVLTALTQAGTANAAPSGPGAQPHRSLSGSTPAWLPKAQRVGTVSSAAAVDFRVYLAPRGGIDAVKAAVAAVSTPGSADYRRFSSAAQYHQQYDPTAATVDAVTSWLAAQGLSVDSVGQYNAYLQVSGTVGQTQAAFGTTIGRYAHDGVTVQANTSPLTVPAALADSVLTVTGIDTTRALMKPQAPAPPPAAYNNAHPCSTYYGQLTASVQANYRTPLPKFNGVYLPYAVCGYTGPQFRAAYEGVTDLDGTGVTVGVVDAYASPTIAADANTYAEAHGDGSYLPGQLTQTVAAAFTNVDDCDASGWYGEETLDVEAVHAMAPAANIHYYGAASCQDADLLATLAKVVNDNDVQVVTNSWGNGGEGVGTSEIVAYESVFLQAALQGISFTFSSGDNGDELASTALKQADWPASDPYVTAVGGTSAAIDADGDLAFEAGWGTEKYSLSATGTTWSPLGFLYGAGGGFSKLFDRPAYQNGVVPAAAPPGRAVPDVAMDADPNTGMLVGQTQTFPEGVHYGEYRIGGTSLASPLFAGMTALLIQHASGGLGLLNPTLYGQAKKGTFNDVAGKPKDAGNVRVDYANGIDNTGGLLYSVRTFGQDSSLTTGPGWDDVTGLGSPNATYLTSVSAVT